MKIAICRFCGTSIKRKTRWQEYCSDACRWRSWAQSHPRTRIEAAVDIPPCYYCGLPATDVDHIPPLTIRNRLADLGLTGRYAYHEVQSCHECNIALGSRALFTLPERKRYIKVWLRKRYQRLLRMPTWSDTEIAQIGYTLRTSLLSRLLASEVTRARLDW